MTDSSQPPETESLILWPKQLVLRTDAVAADAFDGLAKPEPAPSLKDLVRSRQENSRITAPRKTGAVPVVARVAPVREETALPQIQNWPQRTALKDRRAPRVLTPLLSTNAAGKALFAR
jgi:hypothetical protein